MTNKTSIKRQATEKAQGMADYEQAVMVVIRQDGTYFIRAARDLDIEMIGDDWMTRYGFEYCGVFAPAGTFNGYSASEILRASIAR